MHGSLVESNLMWNLIKILLIRKGTNGDKPGLNLRGLMVGLNDISLSYLYLDMNIQDIDIEKETI